MSPDNCPHKIEIPETRRRGNHLNVEHCINMDRCRLKTPKHWKDLDPHGSRWLLSGGDPGVLGICNRKCPNDNEGTTMTEDTYDYGATYSPEDNKLRLYAGGRLPSEVYDRVNAAGFRWAPRQELFVAPGWSPSREDLLIELCGEIGDESTTMAERAADRSERFDGYKENRARDAEVAGATVKGLTDGIPLGQPILVGHHSEAHARRDAARIQSGMEKAVKMWKTSTYWEHRATDVIRHARYLDNPGVRARRIKKLGAEQRKYKKNQDRASLFVEMWTKVASEDHRKKERASFIANRDHLRFCFPLDQYPRELPASQYEGDKSLWNALEDGIINPDEAAGLAIPVHDAYIAHTDRWIDHLTLRIDYEKALLEAQGASDLLKPVPRAKQLPLCNYRAPDGIMIENYYHSGEFNLHNQVEMTKAEYAKVYKENRGTRKVENSHRVRMVFGRFGPALTTSVVFLTDSKTHKKPDAIDPPPPKPKPKPVLLDHHSSANLAGQDEPSERALMEQSLRAGVTTQVAPQLFPTPPAIADKMVEALEIRTGHTLLEPSAGTGRLLDAVRRAGVAAVQTIIELDNKLFHRLNLSYPDGRRQADFLRLTVEELGLFDRIIMNPPFVQGVDIKHIQHALTFLRPGGRLVTLCAGGPRQERALREMAETWERLPEGSFKAAGTNVNVVMLAIEKGSLVNE